MFKPHRQPLLPVLAFLAGGISLCRYGGDLWWTWLIPLGLSVIFLIAGRIRWSIWGVSMLLGYLSLALDGENTLQEVYYDETYRYTGIIKKTGITNIGQTLTVELLESCAPDSSATSHLNGNVIVNTGSFITDFKTGDIVSFKCRLTRPRSDIQLPDDIDYSNYYYTRQIVGSSFVKADKITVIGKSRGVPYVMARFREHIAEVVADYGVEPSTATFLNALLLGDSSDLTYSEKEIFSNSGLAHILALSGTHVAIISSFVFMLLLPLRVMRLRVTVYLITVVFIFLYALLTGMSPSVTRAAIMLSLLFIGRIVGRRTDSINTLCLAGILILLFSSRALFEASFQLSFCAVGSILLFSRAINYRKNNLKRPPYFLNIAMVSVFAILGTGLLSAYYFHKFPVYSVIANLPTALLLPVILWTGLVIIFTGLIGLKMAWVAWTADISVEALKRVGDYFAALPGSTITDIYFEVWVFVPYLLGIVALAYAIGKRSRWSGGIAALCFIICVSALWPVNSHRSNIYICGDSKGTEIIITGNGSIHSISTRNNEDPETVNANLKRKHPDFLPRRKADSFNVTNWTSQSGPFIDCGCKTVTFSNMRFHLVDKTFDLDSLRDNMLNNGDFVNYAIMLKKLSHDEFREMLRSIPVDTVILPRQLHSNYTKAFKSYMDTNGVPYISLREETFWR